jgi:hypothetical protein
LSSYWEQLAEGSQFHRAELSENTLKLYPVTENNPQRIRFNQISEEAMGRARAEGHHVIDHKSDMDSHGVDYVVVAFSEAFSE